MSLKILQLKFHKGPVMKRLTLLLSLTIVMTGLSNYASAQYYFYNDSYYDSPVLFEVGGSLAIMNSLTDIGGKKGIGKKFIKDLNIGKPFLLAGGIGPGDVNELQNFANESVAKDLFAIDINSRFEVMPGVKDIDLIKAFQKNYSKK